MSVAALTDLSVVFSLPFMYRALIAIVVLSLAAGVVGVFISFRELEFVSDGLVHAVFPGLVIGMMVGGTNGLLPGAAGAAIIAAVLFALVGRRSSSSRRDGARAGRGSADAGIAVILTGLFSLGVVLVSRGESYVSQLQELLFGRVLTVTTTQLWQIAVVALAAMLIIAVTHRAQLYRAFDPAGFEAAGFSVMRTDIALNISVALLVVAGVQALGVLMVIAVLVIPVAIARLLTRRLGLLAPVAFVATSALGFLGLWASFEWSVGADLAVSPGPIIVLLLVAAYVLTLAIRQLATAGKVRA